MKRFFASNAVRAYLLTGILVGGLGTLLFGMAHALLLVPIWGRLAGGLAFAIPAGILLTWAFDECCVGNATVRLGAGAWFGLAVWVLLLPMTAFAAWLRLSGVRAVLGPFEVVLEGVIVAASAFLGGWFFTRRLRASSVLAGALVMVVLVMAGPVPVTGDARGARLFVSFLPIYVASGVFLAAVFRVLISRKAPLRTVSTAPPARTEEGG